MIIINKDSSEDKFVQIHNIYSFTALCELERAINY